MPEPVTLRAVIETDLPIFFNQQLDPEANHLAAFTSKDPTDRAAFFTHWRKILAIETVLIRSIIVAGEVVGSVLSYVDEGKPEISYWLGKDYWGKGYATQALAAFLKETNQTRPIHARVVKDNLRSLGVLRKCGFQITGKSKGFANARGAEVEEYLLALT
jgi:RimJ/RimL family protein N-acetyltransferase